VFSATLVSLLTALLASVLTAVLALPLSCTKSSNPSQAESYGVIEIRARVVNLPLAKQAGVDGVAATAADRLIIEVSSSDLAPVRFESGRLDLTRPSLNETISRVPVGRNRRVAVWAVDRSGNTVTHIDSLESRTVNIEAGVVTPVFATLIPAAGSIYLQFAGLSTAVHSVSANFTSHDEAFVVENTVRRDARTFMSLDNIPHLTSGILTVGIIATNGDTTHIATRELTFNARGDNSIDLQFFENSGMIGIDVAIFIPGVTVGSYNFNNGESTIVETGELIITEIMWNVSNDNYIELYNPSDEPAFFETLTTDIDGTIRDFENVSVGPNAYLVIGRREMPHVDIFPPTTGGLPISTTGNWITVRRGRSGPILDRVICAGNNGALGWPTLSSTNNRSIELARDKYCVIENNFGKNWQAAEEPIPGTNQFGTPGR
jgi:hypothetical protein